MKTLIKCKFGSSLYGTETPESDTDYKAVHIPAGNEIIMSEFSRVVNHSTGSQNEKNTKDDVDDESFSLCKYFDMLRSGDMIAYELLFVNPEQSVVWTDEWEECVRNQRRHLMDKNIKGFIGYIRKQVNKYGVKGSRVAAARDAMNLFDRYRRFPDRYKRVSDIPYDEFDEFVCTHEHCSLIQLPINPNQPDVLVDFFEVLNRKIDFRVSINEAHKIMKKVFEEYGSRALAAESNQGVDWKAVYHAVRVSEQALELVETGNITFPRQNVDDLLKIKRGERPFKEVADQLENNLNLLEEKILTTDKLADKVNEVRMRFTQQKLYLNSVRDYYGI